MTKTQRNSTAAAEESFHKHYAAIWCSQRWQDSLYPALAAPTRQCALVNQYALSEAIWNDGQGDYESLPLPSLFEKSQIKCMVAKPKENSGETTDQEIALPPPQLATTGSQQRLMTHWNLDAASVLAAVLLNVQPGDSVLDLCASPGGKSIAFAQNIWPQLQLHETSGESQDASFGNLTSTEHDSGRHKRLTNNLRAYLPADLLRQKAVSIPKVDGTDILAYRKLSLGDEGYDRVLVDAPCSSERHIIHAHLNARAGGRTAAEMSNWRPVSYKRLVQTQVNLLLTGIRAAKIGGTIMYATCSIEPNENDGVVERVVATITKEMKKGAKWTVKVGFKGGAGDPDLERTLEQQWAERTKHGWIVLPDHPSGGKWGPLFFTMLTKVAASQP